MRHLPNDNTLPELRRVLNLMQEEVDRLKSTGGSETANGLTRAGSAQAKYGSAGVLLAQLQELAQRGVINSGVLAQSAAADRPPANVLNPPTITPKLTRHGELTLSSTDTLELDSRGYAIMTSRLIREVP